MDPIIQTGMRDGFVSMGHGRALINIEKRKDQLAIYEKILENNLSVRETEKTVRTYKEAKDSGAKETKSAVEPKSPPKYINESIDAIKEYLSAKVDISASAGGRGKITIPFHSKEEFKRLRKILTGE